MNTHIEQLAEWWENAEQGVIEKGDTVIHRSDGETTVYVAVERAPRRHPNSRILARAPKPKLAWHDAKAVAAVTKKHPEFRDVWVSDCGEWRNVDGDFIEADDLRDVTPLIEAKVTDETRARAIAAYEEDHGSFAARIDATLNAALGIEAE